MVIKENVYLSGPDLIFVAALMALSIDPGQPKNAVQANPVRHFLPPVDFLFQES